MLSLSLSQQRAHTYTGDQNDDWRYLGRQSVVLFLWNVEDRCLRLVSKTALPGQVASVVLYADPEREKAFHRFWFVAGERDREK